MTFKSYDYLNVADVALVSLGVLGPADVILRLHVSLEDGLRVDVHVAENKKLLNYKLKSE